MRGIQCVFKSPFLQTACGPQPLVLLPELTSWSVPSQPPFWGCSCLVLVLLSPTHWLMYSHVFDSHTMSAWFHGAFPAPAGSTGEAAYFVQILSQKFASSVHHMHSARTRPCSGPGLRAKGQSERRPCGGVQGELLGRVRLGRNLSGGVALLSPSLTPFAHSFPCVLQPLLWPFMDISQLQP